MPRSLLRGSLLFGFHRHTNVFRDHADHEVEQSQAISHFSEHVVMNSHCLIDALVGDEIPNGLRNYLNSFLNSWPVVFPATRRPIRLPTLPFFTADASFQRRRNL